MFRSRRPYARTFQFPLNPSQTFDFLTKPDSYHWRCPECVWEFHVCASTDYDFERLIENHERETHDV